MGNNIIVDKSFIFSVKIVNLCNRLSKEYHLFPLINQLLKSGTSIGANVSEGVLGVSKADFRNKMCIALKEANETAYWIRLMVETNILKSSDAELLHLECIELRKILSAIVKNSA